MLILGTYWTTGYSMVNKLARSITQWTKAWPGEWVSKAWAQQAAADSRGSRTCVCANTYSAGWHTQGEKDELTSFRGTVQSAWQKPPVSRKGGRAGLPKKRKWPPRGTGTTVLTYPCPTSSRVSVAVRGCARVRGKADRRLSNVVTHSRL